MQREEVLKIRELRHAKARALRLAAKTRSEYEVVDVSVSDVDSDYSDGGDRGTD